MTKIQNAKIESTFLGIEDHGILTGFINLNYGGSGQGFGGLMFDYCPEGIWIGRKQCAEFIRGVLDAAGVDKWEDLKGKVIRVRIEDGLAVAIGNIIEDKWFKPRVDLK